MLFLFKKKFVAVYLFIIFFVVVIFCRFWTTTKYSYFSLMQTRKLFNVWIIFGDFFFKDYSLIGLVGSLANLFRNRTINDNNKNSYVEKQKKRILEFVSFIIIQLVAIDDVKYQHIPPKYSTYWNLLGNNRIVLWFWFFFHLWMIYDWVLVFFDHFDSAEQKSNVKLGEGRKDDTINLPK